MSEQKLEVRRVPSESWDTENNLTGRARSFFLGVGCHRIWPVDKFNPGASWTRVYFLPAPQKIANFDHG